VAFGAVNATLTPGSSTAPSTSGIRGRANRGVSCETTRRHGAAEAFLPLPPPPPPFPDPGFGAVQINGVGATLTDGWGAWTVMRSTMTIAKLA
jgi:hypothetical protein